MKAYLDGQAMVLAIPLEDEDGGCILASDIEYRVVNQSGVVIAERVGVFGFTANDTQAVLTISSSVNTLSADGPKRELRVIEIFLTTSSGEVKITHEYLVEAVQVLELGVNSFQSYSEATLLSFDIPGVSTYREAIKLDKIAAMIAAWRNIGNLYLRYMSDLSRLAESDMTRLVLPVAETGNVTLLSAEGFGYLPSEMQSAIRRAQLIEADYLLGSDALGDLRRDGIISAINGESSQYFRPLKPYEGPVCKRAMKELGKYIVHSYRIGRG